MRRVLVRYQAWASALMIVALCALGGRAVASQVTIPSSDEYNVLRFELRHIPDKWLYLSGRFLRGGPSEQEQDRRLGRYLLLAAQIEELGRTSPGSDEIRQLRGERQHLENTVEAVIEGRLTSVLEDEALASSLPLFPDARWLFPPVDFELDPAPHVLIISPRDRIELIDQRPVRADLTASEIGGIESELEQSGSDSALVDNLAGMATYPTIVRPRSSYEMLVETVAHEWVHAYLAFKPLGLHYNDSVELRTLNETVADIAGQELAARVVARYPLPSEASAAIDALRPVQPDVDVEGVLRDLRLDVDALLMSGRIAQAETLMEERRQELADEGVYYRRINQAFFAFRGLYATEPGSIDPIGEKLGALRSTVGSTGAFLRQAAELTSEDALDGRLGDTTARGGTARR